VSRRRKLLTGINNITKVQNYNLEEQKDKDTLSKDAFLTLLISQLKNQDPFEPINPTDFTNQLTQLAQLEQSYNFTNSLKDFSSTLEGLKKSNLMSLLGKNVKFKGNVISADGNIKGEYYLPFSTSKVEIKIFDKTGKEIRTFKETPSKTGFIEINWDGKDNYGKELKGNFYFQAIALDLENRPVNLDTYSKGMVRSVDLQSNKLFISDYETDFQSLIQVQI